MLKETHKHLHTAIGMGCSNRNKSNFTAGPFETEQICPGHPSPAHFVIIAEQDND